MRSSNDLRAAPIAGRSRESELAKLMKLVDLAIQKGDPFERGVQLAIQACWSHRSFSSGSSLARVLSSTKAKTE